MSEAVVDTPETPPGLLRDLITLTKPRIISLLLVTTVCAMFAAQQGVPNGWLIVWALIGGYMSAGGANTINQFVDRDIDAQVARTALRPIPAGQISVRQAWAYVIACCLAALAILLSLPPTSILLGFASVLLVAAYPFMKRITWWPQAWLGLTFNWGALMGFAAAVGAGPQLWRGMAPYVLETGNVELLTRALADSALQWPALLLYASGVFWTLGYDTIYAIQDLEDDALAGVKSSARRLGAQAPVAILMFYLTSLTLLLGMGAAARLNSFYYLGLIAYGLLLARQARRVRLDDEGLALRLFKSNAWTALVLVAAIVAGTGYVLPPDGG